MENYDILNSMSEENAVNILCSVKPLNFIGDTFYCTIQEVANFYETTRGALDAIISRNRFLCETNGYEILRGDDLKYVKSMINGVASNKTTILGVIPVRLILYFSFILQDSLIAQSIKASILGINTRTIKRKEITFKESLFATLKNIVDIESQYSCCDNKYRIDFYIPKYNLAIEFDENYHKSLGQALDDTCRENRIKKELNCTFLRISESDYLEDIINKILRHIFKGEI